MNLIRHHKLLILMLLLIAPILFMMVSPEFLTWIVRNTVPLAWVVIAFIGLYFLIVIGAWALFIRLIIGILIAVLRRRSTTGSSSDDEVAR